MDYWLGENYGYCAGLDFEISEKLYMLQCHCNPVMCTEGM